MITIFFDKKEVPRAVNVEVVKEVDTRFLRKIEGKIRREI